MPRAPMSGRRKLLLLLAMIQLLVAAQLFVSYRKHLQKGEGYISRRTVAQIIEGLEAGSWVDPTQARAPQDNPTDIILPIVRSRLGEAHEAWQPAVWLFGGFNLGFLVLALLPDRWLQRSRPSDEPLS